MDGEWSTIFHLYKAPTLHLFGNGMYYVARGGIPGKRARPQPALPLAATPGRRD